MPKSCTSSPPTYADTHRGALSVPDLAVLGPPGNASANDLAVVWNRPPALAGRPLNVLVYCGGGAKYVPELNYARFRGTTEEFIAKFEGSGSDHAQSTGRRSDTAEAWTALPYQSCPGVR